jgi:DNA-directed RNA polymerase subunit K/omega
MSVDFLTKSKFSKKVIETVRAKKLSYMDSVLHICEEHNIDPLDVSKYLKPEIKQKIEAEAQNLHFLPKGNELPV